MRKQCKSFLRCSTTRLPIAVRKKVFMLRSLNSSPAFVAISVFLLALAAGGLNRAAAADIALSWIDNSNNETGFLIERKTGTNGTFAQIATVGANVRSYVNAGLAASTTFCYRIRAYNSAGFSAYTPQGCKTTPGASSTFNFSLAHGGNKSVTRGQSISNIITATLTSGSSQSISFSTTGLPSGATASYASSTSCNPTCSRTLNINTLSSTPTGTFPITVMGIGGGLTRTVAFNLTVSAAGTSTTSGSTITVEAETGTLTAPMAVRSNGTASGGKHVEVPEGSGNNYRDSTNGGNGQVRFTINISQAGSRALWARTIAPNGGSDSFYVTRNGTLVKEWSVPRSTTWKWNKVADLSLASGNVQIAFRQREDGTMLDAIILSSDANFNPNNGTVSVLAVAASSLAASDLTLNVSVVKALTSNGSGNGTVTSSPNGINCGTDCSQTYSNGAIVKLIANPASGSVFGGWSGDPDCQDGAVTMNGSIACTATFNAQSNGLTVAKSGDGTGTVKSSPPGINCGSDCNESFAAGTSVKLTATPATGSVFRGWSGGQCGQTTSCTAVVNGSTSVAAIFDTAGSAKAKIGVYRPSTGEFFLDRNGNGKWDGCTVDICFKWLAQSGGLPVAGNWDGGTTTQIGTFDGANGRWYLDRNGNGSWDGCTVDLCITSFGSPGDIPLVRYAKDSDNPAIGIFRSAVITVVNGQSSITNRGVWRFDANGNLKYDGCSVDSCISKFGHPGDIGVLGDWDGSGGDKRGFFEPDESTWRLDYNGNGVWEGCSGDRCYSGFGKKGDLPVTGDWDGAGKARIGVFHPSTGEWFLDKNGNGRIDGCTVDLCAASFGKAGDQPVVGSW